MDSLLPEILCIIVGLIVGGLVSWLIAGARHRAAQATAANSLAQASVALQVDLSSARERASRVPDLENRLSAAIQTLNQTNERKAALEAEVLRLPELEARRMEIQARLEAKSQELNASAVEVAQLKNSLEGERIVSEEKLALLMDAKLALTDQFKAACGADGPQVIYDAVGGDYTEAALRAIGRHGRHLVVGFTAGIPKVPLNVVLLKSCQIIGVYWGEFTNRFPAQHARNVAALMALYREGRIKPAVTERFPLERAGEAIGRLSARDVRGKVVVTIE